MSDFMSLAKCMFKESIRNKGTMFSTLIFPMILLIIFGSVFSGGSVGDVQIDVGVVCSDENIRESLKTLKGPWNLIFYESENDMDESKKDLDALVWISGESVRILKKPRDMSNMGYLNSFEMSLKILLEKSLNGVKNIIVVRERKIHAGSTDIRSVDYLLAGVIAISILSSGMFGVITLFSHYRELGVLRRFKVSPVRKVPFVLGLSFSKFILNLLAAFIMVGVNIFIFHGRYSMNLPLFLVTIISSTLGMMALGIILSLSFRSPTAANNVASIMLTIMMFFSGVYFPITFLPPKLRILSFFMPVRYVADAVRYTLGLQSMSILSFWLINTVFLIAGSTLLWIASEISLKPES
ncbi:MAG: hypothetical protein DRP24_05980 [Thermotoga sp.]|nr:MAG: hypothetical protein DRP24_05980 [Thermotoga sp.]